MMQLTPPPSALRLSFNAEALQSNWQALDRLSGNARAGAAVKANAYGLGVKRVVPALQAAGCQDFFVAHWLEVPDVLAVAQNCSLSVLHGPVTDADAAFAIQTGVKPVINSLGQARRWVQAGGGLCDLMVDTGMNRLGLSLTDLNDPIVSSLEIDVLLSHLVSAEEDTELNEQQRIGWQFARGAVRHSRGSLANSAGIALGSAYHGDLTRPGIALYGGVPRPEMLDCLAQVVQPQASILQVRTVYAGETIGYNATYTATQTMRVGTIALGYADGYLRCWSGKGRFHANGQIIPSVGRVSMDLTVIDLTNTPELGEGDWVTADYALPESSLATGLSQYELLTLLGRRFG